MKIPYWRIQTIELSYRVGNNTKKECVPMLMELGMTEEEAKKRVKGWFR